MDAYEYFEQEVVPKLKTVMDPEEPSDLDQFLTVIRTLSNSNDGGFRRLLIQNLFDPGENLSLEELMADLFHDVTMGEAFLTKLKFKRGQATVDVDYGVDL